MITPRSIQQLLFMVTALVFTGCARKTAEKQSKPAVSVAVQQVQKSNRLQELEYTATIEPDNTARIGFAVPGIVNEVAVAEGQLVTLGQFLAGLEATEYSNALAIANASLEQAEDGYNRLKNLYDKGSLPERDFVDIKTKLIQAKANKTINTKRISDSRLYAPMSGIVTERLIEPGTTAAPGIPAFTIISTAKVYARITVPESEVGNLDRHMDAMVFIPTLGDSIRGKITIINPQADQTSKTYTVKIQLNNPQQRLLPGMMAQVRIKPAKATEIIAIPATAVVRDADGLTYVYTVTAHKKATRKRVTTGSLTGSREVIVTEGLDEGDTIVTEGQTNLRDGAPVSF